MAVELFKALNIRHSTTSSYHPQCNSQAEVCNKTIAKYLAAFVDSSTLDWEHYVPALMFAYKTSFHRSIQATPFSLTYGLEACLPAFFGPIFVTCMTPTKPITISYKRCITPGIWQSRTTCMPQTN